MGSGLVVLLPRKPVSATAPGAQGPPVETTRQEGAALREVGEVMGMHEKAMVGMADDHASGRSGLKDLMEAYERSLILEALSACGGHQRRTAARLNILPTTLHEKMKRLGLLQRRRHDEETDLGLMGSRDFGYSSMAAQGRGQSGS